MTLVPSAFVHRLALLLCLLAPPVAAQDSPFAPGWTLDPAGSALRVQSVKNGDKVENWEIATFTGAIAADGAAEIRIALDSVDTGIDLRNVRMRFLFFETFLFPEAVITTRLDPAALADLPERRRLLLDLPVTLSLHGVTRDLVVPVSVTLVAGDIVAVSSQGPVIVPAADYGLSEGIAKLQEAANVVIVPSGSVSFDMLFVRNGDAPSADTPPPTAADPETPAPDTAAASAALEPAGPLDDAACRGRFDILSAAGNITFRSGSATLDPSSDALLTTLQDIVERCPGMVIEIGGHTDSLGSDADNLRLSDRRAQAVADWLVARGVDRTRFVTRGYGETMPLFPDDTAENRARNRRIEFRVQGS